MESQRSPRIMISFDVATDEIKTHIEAGDKQPKQIIVQVCTDSLCALT